MATNPTHKMDDEKSAYLDREEHFHKGTVGGKIVVPYYYDSNTDTLNPAASGSLITSAYDYMAYTNTDSTTDTYVYKTGGSSGTTVATVTITYTDATKATVSTVTRT